MKVLIVEDERSLAGAIADGLRLEGIDSDLVHDGVSAVWRAREGRYDVILLDIMLPGLNGYRVCSELREHGLQTPILMLTAKDGEYDEAEGLDTGADDYLTKPFSFVVLVARIRALARRGARPVSEEITVGGLSFDPRTHRCTRGTEEIALTPKEAAVLETLLTSPRATATKQSILNNVWGSDFTGDQNIVEVYVAHLRRKIDDPFDTRLIETVRGVGYRVTP
jgi:DNA-binding response OmpR family regulator